LRILQIHTRYREPGGEDVAVRSEAALLRSAGHQVVVHQVENPTGVASATVLLARSAWNMSAAKTVVQVAQESRPDVAHVHNTWFALSPTVLRALHQAGVPVVLTLHNYRVVCSNAQLFRDGRPCEECVGNHPWHGVRHRCYRGSALLSLTAAGTIALHDWLGTWRHDVDLLLAPSTFAKSVFVRAGLPAERIRVKPNFVDDPGRRRVAPAVSSTVLFVGRLVSQKGIDLLLSAWQRFGGDGLELTVIGDGPLQTELKGKAVSGVRFEGRLPAAAVRECMLAGRALVFPSRSYEVQPLVVLEAMAAGLPVLASDLGGMPDLLEPLGPGWLAPPGDPSGWAAALARLADADHVERAGVRARAYYERAFTKAAAAAALQAAYEEVLA
jgi:glycosyltransferase involved in cell wall biosynthesis